jgi:lipoprotein-releasing system ATP-binding protein
MSPAHPDRALLLDVENIRKDYISGDSVQPVLKGLTFQVYKGEFVALLGPSGSGKSTLLSILGTLLRPTAGAFHMLGHDLTTASEDQLTAFRNRYIGFVFQYHHLLPDFTALENVMFPSAATRGRETPEMIQRAAGLLARVGLAERINYKATKLSGGQKQRVAIARALMNNPPLVLADEPTGNLDRETAANVMGLLSEINAERGTSFFISTHDPEIARRCHRRITVVDGKLSGIEGNEPPSTRGLVAAE